MKVTKQDLQILSGLIVTESKLNKESKVSLLNFVQNEASVYQLMALLLDGKVATVSESDKSIIKDRFISSQFPKFIKEAQNFNEAPMTRKADIMAMKSREANSSISGVKTSKPFFKKAAQVSAGNAMTHLKKPMGTSAKVGLVAGGVLAALALYKGAQLAFSKAQRECFKFSGKEKKVCLAKARVRMIEEKIKALAAAKSKCSEAKDPKLCASKITNKVNELKSQASKVKASI